MSWISCGERLPDENGHYLVTVRRTIDKSHPELGGDEIFVKIKRFHQGKWRLGKHIPEWIDECITDEVIAWTPLPEPWTQKEEFF